ncbi:MAG: alpha/beta family hydrolase [Ideonella sp.]
MVHPADNQALKIDVDAAQQVSALLRKPTGATSCFVFAHGAGAGMEHGFMASFADGLAARGIASLRFQFPYMERGSKRPDSPALAQKTVRAAVAEAARQCPACRLIAGGKSFGGRMTSQAEAASPLDGVAGLAFIGFPLHPAGKPGIERSEHLRRVALPMLFLQGTRDELATLDLLQPVVDGLAPRATLILIDDADHSFHVRARSGRNDGQVMESMLDAFAQWAGQLAERT